MSDKEGDTRHAVPYEVDPTVVICTCSGSPSASDKCTKPANCKSMKFFTPLYSTEGVGIAQKPPRARSVDRQTHRTTTVTLAAHAHRGLIMLQ